MKRPAFNTWRLSPLPALLLSAVAFAQTAMPFVPPPAAGPPLPMEATSYHVPVIHNELVTIFRVDIPGHRASEFHVHDRDQVCVVVDEYPPEAYSQPLGGPPAAPRKAAVGEVSFVAYVGKPVTHRAINAGTLSNRSICAVLNNPKPAGLTPETRGAPYEPVLDTERARAWRLKLKPGEFAPAITQRGAGLRVIVGGGEIAEVFPDGRERGMAVRQGDFYWKDAGATRAVRNIGNSAIEFVEIEFK